MQHPMQWSFSYKYSSRAQVSSASSSAILWVLCMQSAGEKREYRAQGGRPTAGDRLGGRALPPSSATSHMQTQALGDVVAVCQQEGLTGI